MNEPTRGVPPVDGPPPPGPPPPGGPPPGPPPFGPPDDRSDRRLIYAIAAVLAVIALLVIVLLVVRGGDGDDDELTTGSSTTTAPETTSTSSSTTTSTTSTPSSTTTPTSSSAPTSEPAATTAPTSSTTTTTTTTTTVPPTTIAPERCRGTTGPDAPDPVATTFYEAWTVDDRSCAEAIATDEAVDELFVIDGAGASWEFQSCESDAEALEPQASCAFRYEGGTAFFELLHGAVDGWNVIDVDFRAD